MAPESGDETVIPAEPRAELPAEPSGATDPGPSPAWQARQLLRAVAGSVQVCVIGDDDVAEILAATAMARYAVNKSVVRLRRDQLDRLPPALAETLPHLPGMSGSLAVICTSRGCLPPVRTVDELIAAMNKSL